VTTAATMPPIHPGEVLMEEYLEPLGITPHRLAIAIGVPPRRINEIVHGKCRITADTAEIESLKASRAPEGSAAEIAAVLTERGLGGDSVDLDARLDQFRRDRAQRASSARSLAQRWASQVAATEDSLYSPPSAVDQPQFEGHVARPLCAAERP